MARPTKLTREMRDRIVQAIRAGNYAEIACRASGISASTYYRWLERGEREPDSIHGEFEAAVRLAEAESEVHAVALLRRAMPGDWRAALAYLERRHPGRWRKHTSSELTGPDGGPIRTQQAGIDLSQLTNEELAAIEVIYAQAAERE